MDLSTPSLSAAMSKRQMQKLKCLFGKHFLIIKYIMENRGYTLSPINPGDGGDQTD